jgi:uncharacterized protein
MDTLPPDPWHEEADPQGGSDTAAAENAEVLLTVACWRCGKDVLVNLLQCPYCRARLAPEAIVVTNEPPPDPRVRSLTRLLGFFGALLGISVLTGVIGHIAAETAPHRMPRPGQVFTMIAILEAIDTAIVLAAWAWVGMAYCEPHRSLSRRLSAWILAFPVLAASLLLNVGYHHFLQQRLNVTPDPIQFGAGQFLVVSVLLICLQPAVIEELFFRYLMFGALRSVMGGHAVAWVTAVMFAAAHVGAPLSMPVLFVLGVVLGYARLASGGIFLPMILHFVHNAVVLSLNANRF